MANVINWFEIPAKDFNRAKKFYNEVLGYELKTEKMGDYDMAFFSNDGEGVSGSVVYGQGYEPTDKGTLIYFHGGDDLAGMLSKIEPAGGKVVVPKTLITKDIGFFAVFIDTEGNKIALHSQS